MAFEQKCMVEAAHQTRGIFNLYLYRSTVDSSGDVVSEPGYFDQCRYVGDPGWAGAFIFAKLADGPFILTVGDDGRTISAGMGSPSEPVPEYLYDIDNVVVIGASIMDQTFRNELAEAVSAASALDVPLSFYDRATSGDDSGDLLSKVPGYISEFSSDAAKTLFFVHIGGNDISREGPYPGGASSLDSNLRGIINQITGAGFKCAVSTLSYRIPPASNPSLPYNENVIVPIIEELLPETIRNGVPIFDLYTQIIDNQGWLESDGIHPNGTGEAELARYIGSTIASNSKKTPVEGASGTIVDAYFTFGGDDGSAPWVNSVNTVDMYNSDETLIRNGATVSISGWEGAGTSGRAGDTSKSLLNDIFTTDFIYIDNTTPNGVISLPSSVIDASATYTVRVVGQRDASDSGRKGDVEVGGVTKIVDAAVTPPEIVEWTGVSGSDLADNGISVTRTSGSDYSYISGVQITRE